MISCYRAESGRWGQGTSDVCITALLSFGLRALETWTLDAGELAHHVTSENLESELWALGNISHYDPRCLFWPRLSRMVILSITFHRKVPQWPLAAFSLLSSGHFVNRPFFLLRQPRYVHFLPYLRFFPWSHWRPGTRRWPHPFQSWGTLAWPTTRWLFCFSTCFLGGTDGRAGCSLLWPEG